MEAKLTDHISNKAFVSKTHKELSKLHNKERNKPIKNKQNILTDTSTMKIHMYPISM